MPKILQRIRTIWDSARGQAARSVNIAHVCANWLIGREIVEEEQAGEERAEHGATLIQSPSEQSTGEYDSGFSVGASKI
ncbi:MAG TPA: DUF1016 N-terminal domain-containing protein [Chthoniobacterales bacterium]